MPFFREASPAQKYLVLDIVRNYRNIGFGECWGGVALAVVLILFAQLNKADLYVAWVGGCVG